MYMFYITILPHYPNRSVTTSHPTRLRISEGQQYHKITNTIIVGFSGGYTPRPTQICMYNYAYP
jgi:hypothetical protein